MAKFGRRRRHGVGGVLAAYLVVLQAALSGLALGAAPVLADPFSVICDSRSTGSSHGPATPHAGVPSCCVVGCQMFGGGMAPPAFAGAPAAFAQAKTEASLPGTDAVPPAAERTSRSARGPPARS